MIYIVKSILMKTEKKQKILMIFFILSLIFVWGQSCIGKTNSELESNIFVELIKPLEEIKPNEIATYDYEFYSHLIRKGAHVIEFSIVGAELALVFLVYSKKKLNTMVVFLNSLMVGMIVGLIDETIQIFSDRGSQVLDVWFDILGVSIGAGVISIGYIIKKRRDKKANK